MTPPPSPPNVGALAQQLALRPKSALAVIRSCPDLESTFFDAEMANYLEQEISKPARRRFGSSFACCGSRGNG